MLSNPQWVKHTPILTTILWEGVTVQQLIRMWTEQSAEVITGHRIEDIIFQR